MKTSMTKIAAALALVAVSGTAMAAVSGTRHNLGSTSNFPNTTTATTEICVFCHTPHGTDSSATVPLWNRDLNTNAVAGYSTYATLNSTTMNAAMTTVGSVSLACLSCHDGTQAVNSLRNEPGFVNNLGLGGMAQGAGNFVEFLSMSVLTTTGDALIYIGTDLTNDHPIGVQYAGSLPAGSSAHGALDANFNAGSADATLLPGGNTMYFIDTNADGTRQPTDLPLYNRVGGSLAGQALVECATCHDPHSSNTSFLRHSSGNNASATCLACHTK